MNAFNQRDIDPDIPTLCCPRCDCVPTFVYYEDFRAHLRARHHIRDLPRSELVLYETSRGSSQRMRHRANERRHQDQGFERNNMAEIGQIVANSIQIGIERGIAAVLAATQKRESENNVAHTSDPDFRIEIQNHREGEYRCVITDLDLAGRSIGETIRDLRPDVLRRTSKPCSTTPATITEINDTADAGRNCMSSTSSSSNKKPITKDRALGSGQKPVRAITLSPNVMLQRTESMPSLIHMDDHATATNAAGTEQTVISYADDAFAKAQSITKEDVTQQKSALPSEMNSPGSEANSLTKEVQFKIVKSSPQTMRIQLQFFTKKKKQPPGQSQIRDGIEAIDVQPTEQMTGCDTVLQPETAPTIGGTEEPLQAQSTDVLSDLSPVTGKELSHGENKSPNLSSLSDGIAPSGQPVTIVEIHDSESEDAGSSSSSGSAHNEADKDDSSDDPNKYRLIFPDPAKTVEQKSSDSPPQPQSSATENDSQIHEEDSTKLADLKATACQGEAATLAGSTSTQGVGLSSLEEKENKEVVLSKPERKAKVLAMQKQSASKTSKASQSSQRPRCPSSTSKKRKI